MTLHDDKRCRRPSAPGAVAPVAAESATTPSKTRRKAVMHELQDLGEALVALDARHLALLAAETKLPERLVDAIAAARTITAWGGRKRQLQYVGKLMREVDPEPIRHRLEAWAHGHHQDTARQHALERLRALIARARAERDSGGPPHAYRELFRELKALES